MSYDIIIKNGLYFDGSDAPGSPRHVGIKDGRIDTLSVSPLDESGCGEVIDASGRWVTPGFLEIHSHYDAEAIAAPALKESVRHGVTTVSVGSCSTVAPAPTARARRTGRSCAASCRRRPGSRR